MSVEPNPIPSAVAGLNPEPYADGAQSALSRRNFLRVAGVAGGGLIAAGVAACQAAAAPAWSFATAASAGAATPAPSASAVASAGAGASASAVASGSVAPSASASPTASLPAGWSQHDLNAQLKVRRFVGNLADKAGLGSIFDPILGGPNTDDPEYTKVKYGNQPLAPSSVAADGTKVFDMTIDEITWQIDAVNPPVKAVGYNKMWPGPEIRVTEGDKLQFNFTNNLQETTAVHFHGVEFDDFTQDGVAFVTQLPFGPGQTYTYKFTATRSGSQMYHSHHNATDQGGRGLLGAFIVEPKDAAQTYAKKNGVTQEVIWIHNDALGGFTINGHGFPATKPIIATKGDKILIRFMNEGTMMHPWHSHGFFMNVVARDGYDLGTAAFRADTLGVNPGERYDAIIDCDRIGAWAFHCHILPHVEGLDGMFGMVTALIILPPA